MTITSLAARGGLYSAALPQRLEGPQPLAVGFDPYDFDHVACSTPSTSGSRCACSCRAHTRRGLSVRGGEKIRAALCRAQRPGSTIDAFDTPLMMRMVR